MIQLERWIELIGGDDRPWLMIGKGPTYPRRNEFDLSEFNIVTLNHIIQELDADVAHIADLDVLEACADRLIDGCRWLLMPRVPHAQPEPRRRIDELFDEYPVLRRLDAEDRLVWYNLHTSPPVGDSEVVGCRWFSSEVVLEVLGRLGATTVRTLGIDGGTSYAPGFAHLEATRLDNGAPNFDVQFFELDRIAAEHGIDLAPLAPPLRVFVGSDESQQVAFRVLEHSIRTYCSQPVDIVNLADHPTREPRDEANRGRTGFSFSRFKIPELCGYTGRALYLDADMLVSADISELWDFPFDGHKVVCTTQLEAPERWRDYDWFHPGRQLSVMLLDCSRLDWKIDDIIDGLDAHEYGYADLMFDLCLLDPAEIGGDLPPEWNHLERHEPGVTKNVHFTVVNDQPWKVDVNPLAPLWTTAYEQAMAAGAIPPSEVAAGVTSGHLKASLGDALSLAPSRSATDGADDAARAHIAVLQAETARLQRRNQRLERRLEGMRGSATWRVGRTVMAPLDRLRRLGRRSRRG